MMSTNLLQLRSKPGLTSKVPLKDNDINANSINLTQNLMQALKPVISNIL